jgi:zinc transport system substrate-binding protein
MISVLKKCYGAQVRLLAIATAAAVLAGCGGAEEAATERSIVASFYPLAWAAERIAADTVQVVNLTPPGAEPHDVELTPQDVEQIRDADLVVYLGHGFQPAVEDVAADRDGASLDVLNDAGDLHVWLDPLAFVDIVQRLATLADQLGLAGDRGAAEYLAGELRGLDVQYRRGLADCDRRVLVTTHAAFGRLAARYGLTELSLSGRMPESEPGPRELEELVKKVRASGATTVFSEPLVSDRVAETVAREAGAQVASLDPIEGLSEKRLAAGEDYLSLMRENLATLRKALGCR